jgi:hypothetical protein
MKSLSFKEPWVNSYVERLLGLSTATKKAIICALERSMEYKSPQEPEDNMVKERTERFWASFGSWEGEGTAEELPASIRNARTENPEREPLD